MTPSWECQSSLFDSDEFDSDEFDSDEFDSDGAADDRFDIFAEGEAAAGASDDDLEWEALGWITECRT